MSDYEKIKNIIKEYLDKKSVNIEIESNIKETSYDKDNGEYLCDFAEDFKVIDMDKIAQDAYGIIYNSGKTKSTVDAFFISNDKQWYFIEFKNTSIDNRKTKDRLQRKAYENLHMLFDIMYEVSEISEVFDYKNNPIEFVRNNINYIVVCNSDKNIREANKVRQYELGAEKYIPGCLQDLNSSVFKNAYLLTEDMFKRKIQSMQ